MTRIAFVTVWSGLIVAAVAPAAYAQATARAEIVVPIQQVFAVRTSVTVPDRGTMYLGGVDRASSFRSEFRPGFSSGISESRSSAGASVRVWIHDFSELDPAGDFHVTDDVRPATGFAGAMNSYATTRDVRQSPTASAAKSAEADAAQQRDAQFADLLARGQDAEARGKLKIARLYYQSASRLAAGARGDDVRSRLIALDAKLASR